MKNKKGFTLIELLAVIVILAIIALIAIPIILNMINEARKASARSAALGYVEAIEYNNGFAQLEKDGYVEIVGEDIEVTDINIKLKGRKPDSGTVTVNNKGKVISASNLCFYGYKVNYDGKDATVNGKCNSSSNEQSNNNNNNNNNNEQSLTPQTNVSGPTTTTVSTIVYFDPVSTSTCDSSHFDLNAIKAGTSTCYKWRIISASGNNLTVQMDHNLFKGQWSTASTSGPNSVLTNLADRTPWTRIPALNYTYDTTGATNNYGIMTCDKGICNKIKNNSTTLIAGTTETPVRARLITGEEITTITKNAGAAGNSLAGTWTLATSSGNWYYFSNSGYTIGTQTSGTNNKALAWLLENIQGVEASGATDNAYGSTYNGYWTLSPVSNVANYVWLARFDGSLRQDQVTISNNYGARPVLTLPKCVFDGNKCTGWHLINPDMETWSYYQSSGEIIQNGWGKGLLDLSGVSQDYYFENGTAVKGLKTIDNKTYYFEEEDTDGNNYIDYNMVKNKSITKGNTTYTFGADGACTNC